MDKYEEDEIKLINEAELRRHGEIVLGRPINFDGFEYFSCSC